MRFPFLCSTSIGCHCGTIVPTGQPYQPDERCHRQKASSSCGSLAHGYPINCFEEKIRWLQALTAVGEVLRRLTSHLCWSAARLLVILLRYGQMGVDIKGGLEAAVHTMHSFISSHSLDEDLCCLKVDMLNAFNECGPRHIPTMCKLGSPRPLCLGSVVLPLLR